MKLPLKRFGLFGSPRDNDERLDGEESPSLLQTALHIVSAGVQWGLAGFFVICALVFLPSASSALFVIAALLAAPIPFLREKVTSASSFLPIGALRKTLVPVLTAGLFVAGALTAPTTTVAEYGAPVTRSAPIPAMQDSNQPQQFEMTIVPLIVHARGVTDAKVDGATDQMDLAEATLTANTTVLEYSNKTTDPMTLVTCSDTDVKVSSEDKIDLATVGKQQVSYTLAKGEATREEKQNFTVRDTKAPTIALAHENITIEQGGSFDPKSFVKSVTDPVDGDLPFNSGEPETDKNDPGNQRFYDSGWWTVTGSYDVNAPNKYFLNIVACDLNGNRVSKEVSLTVNEPPKPEPEETYVEPERNTTTYVVNISTGKFHYPSCGDVSRMKDSNKWVTDEYTRDELIAEGYSPCKHCNP